MALTTPQAAMAAEYIHVNTPTNVDCANAQPFCSSIVFSYDNHPAGATCLWFQFTVTSSNPVCIQANTFKAHLIPAEGMGHCVCPSTNGGDININGPLAIGTYYLVFEVVPHDIRPIQIAVECGLVCQEMDCNGCLPSFLPMGGERYIVTAWVKKENAAAGTVDYSQPQSQSPYLHLEAPIGTTLVDLYPSIAIPVIEEWQQVEGSFLMPTGTPSFALQLRVDQGSALFDDVRLFPADGSMKCYVYDPTNLRFTAELDERHFATFYEYDNEGKLVRVKKETERGVMTIQESRQNAAHHTMTP
jgi:hypothetical protein